MASPADASPPRPAQPAHGGRKRNPPLLSALRADAAELAAVKGGSYSGRGGVADIVTLPAFWVVVMWRLSNFWHERGLRALSRLTYFANVVIFGADLAPGSVLGPGLVIPHPVGVACGTGVEFGERCHLMGMVRIGGSGQPGKAGHPVIGDDVWLMDGARIFGPVSLGDRTVVGASALITEDVPADMLVRAPKAPIRVRPRTDGRVVADPPEDGDHQADPEPVDVAKVRIPFRVVR